MNVNKRMNMNPAPSKNVVSRAEAIQKILQVLEASSELPPTILVDGLSGSGKTSLIAEVRRRLTSGCSATSASDISESDTSTFHVEFISMEELYEGWSGLKSGSDLLSRMLTERLAKLDSGSNLPVTFESWDWALSKRSGIVSLSPGAAWIVEGCGSISGETAPFGSTTFWVERGFFARLMAVWRREKVPLLTWLRWERDSRKHAQDEGSAQLTDFRVTKQ